MSGEGQPFDDGKGFKSYLNELGDTLTYPDADMGPRGIAGSILRQLLGPQNELLTRERDSSPKNIPGMPYYKFKGSASDIPGSPLYKQGNDLDIPTAADQQGLDGYRRIIEQLVGQQGGNRT